MNTDEEPFFQGSSKKYENQSEFTDLKQAELERVIADIKIHMVDGPVDVEELLALQVVNISARRFEPTKFLYRLSKVTHFSESWERSSFNRLYKIILKAIPLRNYDHDDIFLRYNHVTGLRLITMFS